MCPDPTQKECHQTSMKLVEVHTLSQTAPQIKQNKIESKFDMINLFYIPLCLITCRAKDEVVVMEICIRVLPPGQAGRRACP